MGIGEQLAQFLVATSFEDLPPEAVLQAKRAILDTLGVALAGCREEGPAILARLAQEHPAPGKASVLGWPLSLAPQEAAFINGTSAHALDYDDVSISMRGHPSAPVLPAALALAQEIGVSGRALILAFVLGIEVEAKVGTVMGGRHYALGWHPTSTLGTLGAAAACATLLGLDVTRTQMALGIAASMACGVRANFGTMTKPLHVGLAARNGLQAALLALQGFTAAEGALDAPDGFLNAFLGGRVEAEPQLPPLGQPYDIVQPGLGQKRYPCCYATHRAIDAALGLAHQVEASDIAQVKVRVNRGTLMPLRRERPHTGLEGKFSMEYCVAAALLDRHVGMATFTDEAVTRPQVAHLMDRIEVEEEASSGGDLLLMWADVTILTRGGGHLSARVEIPKGDPRRPLTWQELADKFRDCACFHLPPGKVEEALTLISHLEEVEDVSALALMLQP
ncbi:MAG: MmgE/PrpD family protein [Dehalococcoidia bacterium]|jgi:2-methylcitrate dehydratase PrpD|nr:MmgE/PrpD family protein [Dehalococcoidia bacterium]